jgi:transmembrane sensor
MENRTPSPELLQRYLAGTCSDAERKVIDDWYEQINLKSGIQFSRADEDHLLARIEDDIKPDKTEISRQPHQRTNWWIYAGAVAAMLLLALAFAFYSEKRDGKKSTAAVLSGSFTKITNTQRKVLRCVLPDQSIVWLQPGAGIAYPKSFMEDNAREVKFQGEAFFNVSEDHAHPFIIHSGKLKTVVVGTSFNVKANDSDPTYLVSVVTGSVSVSSESEQEKSEVVLLKPQQQAIFSTETNDITKNTLATKNTEIETWQPVTLTFEDASLRDIVTRLQKTFKVKITIASPALRECILKVDFNNQNLPEILEMINTLVGSTYEINGQNITLSGEGCSSR